MTCSCFICQLYFTTSLSCPLLQDEQDTGERDRPTGRAAWHYPRGQGRRRGFRSGDEWWEGKKYSGRR